jgi:hypothetical protein
MVIRSLWCENQPRRAMMGCLNHDQGHLFYSFYLEYAVLDDLACVLDLQVVRSIERVATGGAKNASAASLF